MSLGPNKGRKKNAPPGGRPKILPCRAVSLAADRSALAITLWALPERDFYADGDAIERDWVRQLLQIKEIPFSDSDLDDIHRALNLIRITVHAKDALSFDPLARIGPALTVLLEDLPTLIDLAHNPPLKSQPKLPLAAALQKLLIAAQVVDRLGVRNVPGRRGAAAWHGDAMWLAFLLRQSTANVGAPLERVILKSAEGNGVNFIFEALKRAFAASEKHWSVTTSAIVQAIDRYAEGPIPGITVSTNSQ